MKFAKPFGEPAHTLFDRRARPEADGAFKIGLNEVAIQMTLRGLGLTRLGKSVILKDGPAMRGMVAKVAHLVETEG